MKKVLMSTTALVVASVALANVASAEVSVSGGVSYFLTYKSGSKNFKNDSDAEPPVEVFDADGFYKKVGDKSVKEDDEYKVNLNVEQLAWQSEVVVSGGGVTDAGLSYGASAQLRAGIAAVTTDEAIVHVGGDSWGKVIIGHDDDALDRTQVHAGSNAVGLGHEWNETGNKLGGNDDYAKIVYETPSLNGFNAAVSLEPNRGGGNENAIAAGANFSTDVGGGSIKVGGGVRIQSTTNRKGELVGDVKDGESIGDLFGFQAGVMGTFDAFSVAVGFGSGTAKTTGAKSKDTELAATNMGLTVAYDFGQGGVSASYLSYNDETKVGGTSIGKTSSNSIVLDADYKLADGLVAQMEVALNSKDPNGDKADTGSKDAPSNTIFGVGLAASF